MNHITDRRRKRLFLVNIQRKIKLDLDYLQKLINHFERRLTCSIVKIDIVLVGDRKIIKLNKLFLNKNQPTDVLTFNLGSTAEIIISVETAKRQALQESHSVEQEILYLIIHGILHISGYDDSKPASYDKMKRKQDEIFFAVLRDFDEKRKKSGHC